MFFCACCKPARVADEPDEPVSANGVAQFGKLMPSENGASPEEAHDMVEEAWEGKVFFDPKQPGISDEERTRRRWELIDYGLEQLDRRKQMSKFAKMLERLRGQKPAGLPPTRFSSPT